MDIRTYDTPADFMAVAGPVLEEEETANNLMLGIAARLLENPLEYGTEPFLATAHDAEQVALVAIMTPPFPLQFYAPRLVDAGLAALVEALRAGGTPIPGVMARPDQARAFAEYWCNGESRTYRPTMASRLHVLRAVANIDYSPGEFAAARPEHVEQIVEWTSAFHAEAVPHDILDVERVRRNTEKRIAKGEIALWADGRPVSMAFRSRPMATNESVSGVYTPPELRGKGYATSCVARLSQAILDSGKQFCCLFTDLANPTSNKIYARVGYKPVADLQRYDFGA